MVEPVSIEKTDYRLREIVSLDASAYQMIYEQLKNCGQYYAYLSNCEIHNNGITFDGIGERFVKKVIDSAREIPRKSFRFAIVNKNDRAIGYVVALLESDKMNDPLLQGGCEIGYFISPTYQRKGIITLSTSTLIKFMAKEFSITSVWGTAHPQNVASIAIFKKLGMRFLKETISTEDKENPERLLFIREFPFSC